MGFLKNIINRFVNRAVDKTVDSAADRLVGQGMNKVGNKLVDDAVDNAAKSINENTSVYAARKEEKDLANLNKVSNIGTKLFLKIDEVLKTSFAQFELKRNLSADDLKINVREHKVKPYSFCLFKDGALYACITITEHNQEKNKFFHGAKESCLKNGAKFINFFTQFKNEPAYILERLRKSL